MLAREGLAQRRHDGVAIESFDGADRGAIAAAGMDDAGAGGRAVDLDRAGAAHALLAANVGAGQHQLAAQELGELLARFGPELARFAIDDERDRDLAHIRPIFSTARRSAVSARARRQGGSPGTPSAMRAASPAGSLVNAEASSITNGGPSSAPSTARGASPGRASTQTVAFENSPTLRPNFQWPQRPSAGS